MFHQPRTLAEALELRRSLGPSVTVINGGTDVVVAMNHGSLQPVVFLDLSGVEGFRKIEPDNGSLLIGAGATFAQLGRLDIRALREASLSVGGPAIRNRGTIGGNLVSASPAADGAVALLSLGAEVELSSTARGARWIPLTDFFVSYRKIDLADDELVTRIRVLRNAISRWYKIGKRSAVNISIVCCSVARRPDGSYGIALGSVAPMPITIPKAEGHLADNALTGEIMEEAAGIVGEAVSPVDDHRASAAYRRAMCQTLTRRLLADMASGDQKGEADG